MRQGRVLAPLLLLVACGRDEPNLACPSGTKAHMMEKRGNAKARRACFLEGGWTSHGPIVELDDEGRERLVGRMVRGKREGRFVEIDTATTSEAVYRDGLVHGTFALRHKSGVLWEQEFDHGHPHGRRREWESDGQLRSIEHYDRGVPTGEWMRATREGTTKRVYGSEGVLVAVDGKGVAPPPEALTLPDGSAITRSECVRRAETYVFGDAKSPALCLGIFEEVQLCQDEACKQAAIARLDRD